MKAATDITGFGLGGHLLEMIDASRAGARVNLKRIPLYPGVLDLARSGVASTLLPENMRLATRLVGAATEDAASMAVLFDPQTSGGLLAGVPADCVDACLADLIANGVDSAVCIGEVTADTLIVAEGTISVS